MPKTARHIMTLILTTILVSPSAQASDWDRHPLLDDRFVLSLGTFALNLDTHISIKASGGSIGQEFNIEQSFDLDESQRRFSGTLHWRFGEKWSAALQYFDYKVGSTAVLERDIHWGESTLQEGSYVSAGSFGELVRMLAGRTFSEGPRHEFGAGIGVHWLEIGLFAEGEFFLDGTSSGVERRTVSAGAPLPNLGAWYMHAWSNRWAGFARLDWLSASIDEYDGSILNGAVGVNYQFTRHLGVGLNYNYVNLDVKVDSGSWNGEADLTRDGPFLFLNMSW